MGSQKQAKREAKIETFRDPCKVDFCLYLQCLSHIGGSQNHSKIDPFFEGSPGASFLGSRRLKKAAKADFRHFFTDFWSPFGTTFCIILHFFEVLNSDAFLIDFGGVAGVRGGGCGACKYCRIRLKFHHAATPAGCGEFIGSASAASPFLPQCQSVEAAFWCEMIDCIATFRRSLQG